MTGNRVTHLTKGYTGLFSVLPYVAVSPYLVAGFAGGALFGQCLPHTPSNAMFVEEFFAGIGTCVLLTIFPVLPACTALTAGIALSAAVVAGLSAIITYPIALGLDCSDEGTINANPTPSY